MDFETFLLVSNYVGTIAFAVSGVVKGFKKKLDIFGITLLAIVTAVGGGMIRDSLVGRIPAALVEPSPIYLSIAVSLIMYVVVSNAKSEHPLDRKFYLYLARINLLFDAIGLVIFALLGASTGIEANLNPMATGILASLTGVGGGIIRDLLVNETPSVLKEDVYALLAFFTGLSYHLLVVELGFSRIPTFSCLFLIFFILRLLIIKYQINLPNMESSKKP
ncbi:TPA: trimeric intracellular cation channel family protein [Streptococcus suis]|uniref:Trimeric intracellular cation channel family protein n=1 Tax=Streptococcus suivaginalis TaxID=3028082 RepID=A0AA96VSQ7_9STRE|nr:trimeric intracellular cation channel family protein [Streptococcus sp. 29896]MBM7315036.1 trimeric intracellular cation channel family protein [Streptococcus suis]MCK4026858.1 trimeric intracellular cation channel family protein [Streptococcus suis]WNY47490.1 trimeric intracellular cation channel family protein [Streptococcus sp. 29896]HEL1587334.1 trimeric intracellular cation channel family protein [Streptococcus suis]